MENICLDTDFIVDFLRNKKEAIEFIKLNEKENNLSTTYINLFELYYGAWKSNNSKNNLEALEKFSEKIEILNLNKESVKEAGKQLTLLEKSGEPIDFRDLLIGTIALVNNYSVKTNNLKHFSKIKGLVLK